MKETDKRWRGDLVSYQALHCWIRKYKPKVKACEACGEIKKLEIANISRKYKRDINDFKWLCRKCHLIFDNIIETNLIKFKKGAKPWNKNTKGIMKANITSFKKGVSSWNKGTNLSGMKGKKHSEKTKRIIAEKTRLRYGKI